MNTITTFDSSKWTGRDYEYIIIRWKGWSGATYISLMKKHINNDFCFSIYSVCRMHDYLGNCVAFSLFKQLRVIVEFTVSNRYLTENVDRWWVKYILNREWKVTEQNACI